MKRLFLTGDRPMITLISRPRATVRFVVFATLAAIGPMVGFPGTVTEAQTAPPRPALSVSAITPTRETLALRLPANGSIAAWDEAPIGAETVGLRLVEVRASVGDTVRRGDVLAVFASATLEADLAQAEAAVRELEAQWAEARDNAERARKLRGTEALSATQLAQYLSAEQIAAARLQGARAQEQGARARLAQTRVLAPDSGIISARAASVGSVPQPGQELFRLIRQGRLEWRAEVTSDELLRIKPGTPAQLDLPGGITIGGRVRMLAPLVDPQTRNAVVHVDVAAMNSPEGARLRPGMFVRGRFVLGESSTLVVPQSAIAMRDGFSYVFRIEPDQRVT
ncbi:MAG: efflux RND transporter periplasmic adaptor subunit, partial [Betaproteobacteria bacterium]|nr:efflux RND transporter periplasmic adaptor subunit [Betaproteobacteria bacterium]